MCQLQLPVALALIQHLEPKRFKVLVDFGGHAAATHLRALLQLLRPNVSYITVSQHDNGASRTFSLHEVSPNLTRSRDSAGMNCGSAKIPLEQCFVNVLQFSAGGFGHVPVPLIKPAGTSAPSRHTLCRFRCGVLVEDA